MPSDTASGSRTHPQRRPTSDAAQEGASLSKFDLVQKAFMAPFNHKKSDSTRILSDRTSRSFSSTPFLMTTRLDSCPGYYDSPNDKFSRFSVGTSESGVDPFVGEQKQDGFRLSRSRTASDRQVLAHYLRRPPNLRGYRRVTRSRRSRAGRSRIQHQSAQGLQCHHPKFRAEQDSEEANAQR